jgi:hypothetical protein
MTISFGELAGELRRRSRIRSNVTGWASAMFEPMTTIKSAWSMSS